MLRQQTAVWHYLPESSLSSMVSVFSKIQAEYLQAFAARIVGSDLQGSTAAGIHTRATFASMNDWQRTVEEKGARVANQMYDWWLRTNAGDEVWEVYLRRVRIPHLLVAHPSPVSPDTKNAPLATKAFLDHLHGVGLIHLFCFQGDAAIYGQPMWLYFKQKTESIKEISEGILCDRSPADGESALMRFQDIWQVAFPASRGAPAVRLARRDGRAFLEKWDKLLLSELGEQMLSECIAPLGASLAVWMRASK